MGGALCCEFVAPPALLESKNASISPQNPGILIRRFSPKKADEDYDDS
jgi:hypothetical protein